MKGRKNVQYVAHFFFRTGGKMVKSTVFIFQAQQKKNEKEDKKQPKYL